MRTLMLTMLLCCSGLACAQETSAVERCLQAFRELLPGLQAQRDDADEERQRLRNVAGVCLAYLGSGYDHKTPNRYRNQVRALLTVIEQTTTGPDGLYGGDLHSHALASMALAEAYAMTMDPHLAPLAQDAIDTLNAFQSPAGWWAASLDNPTADLDGSTLACMACRSAAAAGLRTDDSLSRCRAWATTAIERLRPTDAPGTIARYLVMGAFTGLRNDAQTTALIQTVIDSLPASLVDLTPAEHYFWTLAVFQLGPQFWRTYEEASHEILLERAAEDHARSTHEIEVNPRAWVDCLNLEIYWRRSPVR